MTDTETNIIWRSQIERQTGLYSCLCQKRATTFQTQGGRIVRWQCLNTDGERVTGRNEEATAAPRVTEYR